MNAQWIDGLSSRSGRWVGNPVLTQANADVPVTLYLPADDIAANVARLVALLNEHWPIDEDAATWFERVHGGWTAAEEEDHLQDTIKADLGTEGA